MVLCLHLVFRRATTLASRYASRNERKPVARNPDRMGTNLQQLLEVLGRVDLAGRRLPLDSWIVAQKAMASLTWLH